MALLAGTTWAEIEELRARINDTPASTAAEAATRFVGLFSSTFPSVVLARLFMVVPFGKLPPAEQAVATAFVSGDPRLRVTTPVLSLLATCGREADWNHRARSRGHLAIPLLDSEFVKGAPMIAKLLADLEVDLAVLDDGRPIATRRMLGGRNGTFYVPDAPTACDNEGRHIIPSREFVTKYGVRTAFGMGGAYLDGSLAVAILFSTEDLDRLMVDRFPSFISNYKMATAALVGSGRIYSATS